MRILPFNTPLPSFTWSEVYLKILSSRATAVASIVAETSSLSLPFVLESTVVEMLAFVLLLNRLNVTEAGPDLNVVSRYSPAFSNVARFWAKPGSITANIANTQAVTETLMTAFMWSSFVLPANYRWFGNPRARTCGTFSTGGAPLLTTRACNRPAAWSEYWDS